jgi:hypothetical protein
MEEHAKEILDELLGISTKKLQQGDDSLSQDIVTAIQIVENQKGVRICG